MPQQNTAFPSLSSRSSCKEDLFHGIDLENYSIKVKQAEMKGIPIELKR
jgi:hypothetical protein